MRKREKEALLIAFLQEKIRYEKLGDYIVHLIKDDPSAPKNNFHTIIYRIKEERRFIEKIERENKSLTTDQAPITVKNFQQRVGDLLGIRLICLRLADIKILEAYFVHLAAENIFEFIEKPKLKRSFILPVDPGDEQGSHDLLYGGYSSVHYQIKLSDGLAVPDEIKGLQAEFQLRTILEEAWGEIDHKYRYAYSRSGAELPEYIHSGFYNLSAYLQAAAMQAEYLCRQVEMHSPAKIVGNKKKREITNASIAFKNRDGQLDTVAPTYLPVAQQSLEKIFGFKLNERTVLYILKRFQKFGISGQHKATLQKIIQKKHLREFRAIFSDMLAREPFADKDRRNVDVINAVNFSLFHETQGSRLAAEGLRSVLKYRKEYSGW